MKVSVYSKSGITPATTYYRLYQYFRELDIDVCYRKQISERMYNSIMPIAQKPMMVKIWAGLVSLFRVSCQLIADQTRRPEYIIVSRRFTNRIFPKAHKWLIKRFVSRGGKLIWDFDDEIIVKHEISRANFDWMSDLASVIVVAGTANKNMVKPEYQEKVRILPTTDGDMYKRFNEDCRKARLASLEEEVRIVWVGTSVSLPFVAAVCPHFERAAERLRASGQKLSLTVVCDSPLEYSANHFQLRNIKWNREEAIRLMLSSHIGIMPLEDNEDTRGKGGFKLIQYLSVGLPIIGSAVGINKKIITDSVGRAVDGLDSAEWEQKVLEFVSSKEKYTSMQEAAYERWKTCYSYDSNLMAWSAILKSNKL